MAVIDILDTAGDDRDGRDLLIARDDPAVLEFTRHRVQVVVGGLENRVQTDDIPEGARDEHVEAQPLPLERIAD